MTPIRSAAVLSVAAMALLSACSDATAPVQTGGLPKDLESGIYPLISVASRTSSTAQIDLYLKRVPSATRLASYQGELTYDASALTLEHTDLPAGMIGTTNEVSPGHVRFAGAALDGLGDVPVLSVRFTRHGALGQKSFEVRVEELAGAEDFADLTSQVSPHAYFQDGTSR
jgi:hypothetical protein